jgi:O-antigen ligase
MSHIAAAVSLSTGIAGLVVILVFFGVVLPAVWSGKRTRRTAASTVLQQLLDAYRDRPRR